MIEVTQTNSQIFSYDHPDRHMKLRVLVSNNQQLGPTTFFYQKLMISREDFEVKSQRNLILKCSLYSPVRFKDQERPWIIFLHGNSSSRLDGHPMAGLICNEGMSYVTFDFGGSGISEGSYVSLGWFEKIDLLSVVEHMRLNYPKLTRLGLWGRSMGATTALLSVLQNEELATVIVADSPFSSLKQLCLDLAMSRTCIPTLLVRFAFYIVRKRIQNIAKFDLKNLELIPYIKEIKSSILFLHAENDMMVNEDQVRKLFKACRTEKYFTQFSGDHNSTRPIEVLDNLVRFFVNRLLPNRETPMFKKLSVKTPKKQESEFTNDKLNASNQYEGVPEYDYDEKIHCTNRNDLLEEPLSSDRQFDENISSKGVPYKDFVGTRSPQSGSDSERFIPVESMSRQENIQNYELKKSTHHLF